MIENVTKVTKFRIFFSLIILLINLLAIPGGLFFLNELKLHGATIIHGYSYSFSHSIAVLIDSELRTLWLWLQPAIIASLIWIWTVGRTNLHQFTDDMPVSAGHGQFGTARWMSEKEVDKTFTVHKF